MKSTYKSKLTYKALFGYSLVIIALLIVAVPVFATTGDSPSSAIDSTFVCTTNCHTQSKSSCGRDGGGAVRVF